MIETSREVLVSDTSWQAWTLTARFLPSGYIGAVITTIQVEYVVTWANPFWELCGLDPKRQVEQISASIRRVVGTLEAPPAAILELSDSSLGTTNLPVLARAPVEASPCYSTYLLSLVIVGATYVFRPIHHQGEEFLDAREDGWVDVASAQAEAVPENGASPADLPSDLPEGGLGVPQRGGAPEFHGEVGAAEAMANADAQYVGTPGRLRGLG